MSYSAYRLETRISTLLIVLATLQACGREAKPGGKVAEKSVASSTEGVSLTITESRCRKANYAAIETGQDANFELKISGGNPDRYKVGYMAAAAEQVVLSSSRLTLRAPSEGTHKISVFLRDVSSCNKPDLNIPDCQLNQPRVEKTSVLDFALQDVRVVSGRAVSSFADTSNIGQGGGMVGTVLRKEGIMGMLGNTLLFSDGGAGGGGLMGMIGGLLGGAQQPAATPIPQPASPTSGC